MGRDDSSLPTPPRERVGFTAGALLAALALAVRLVAWLQYEVIPRDGIDFLRQAAHFLDGDWRAALDWYQHPVTAGLFASVARVTGLAPETAAGSAALVCGALAVVPVTLMGAALFGRRAGLAAGVLFAILPFATRLAVRPLSEGPFHLFFLASAAAAVLAVRSYSNRAAGIVGVAGGLAFLTRPEGLAAPLVGAALLLAFPASGVTARRRLGLVLLLGLGLLITVGPYVAYLSQAHGRLTLTAKKDVTVLAGARGDRPVQRLSDEGLADRPGKTAVELGKHLGEALTWAPLGLALLGLLIPRRRRTRGEWLVTLIVLLLLVVLFRVGTTYGYIARRHLLTPGVLLLVWSGAGLTALAARLGRVPPFRRRDVGLPRAGAALAAMLVLFAAVFLPVAWKPIDERHLPLKNLGLRARDGLGTNFRLAPLGFPRVAYYAGSPWIAVLPHHQDAWCDAPEPAALAALGAGLDHARVTHVVLSNRQPAGPRAWIAAHADELFRVEQDGGKRWWAVCRYRRGDRE